jgi:hypothetical protein
MPTKFTRLAAIAVACALPLAPAVADVHSNTLKWNGIKLNGLKWNGITLNGLKWNGRLLNGLQLNGSSPAGITAADDWPVAVDTITLPNGTVIQTR